MANSTLKKIKTKNLSLKDSEMRYRRLFETAQDGILILDAETGSITDVNPFLINMLGYSKEEFIEKKLWEVGAFKDIKASKEAFLALQKNEYIRYKNLPLKTSLGKLIQVEFVSNVYLVGNKKVIQCNIRDITQQTQTQKALLQSQTLLREQSVKDHLTGLYNRRYLEETLERELRRAMRKGYSVGIIMFDVDYFKHFNDTFGHAAGDIILMELGKLIQKNIRKDDFACRYGGDEFIIVFPDASRETTLQRAALIRDSINKINIKFEDRLLEAVHLSLGVAMFPDDGKSSTVLLRIMDIDLLRDKREWHSKVALV
jgi:diguanylate cyclase (GGDEF)-like protein/PAS domain S-box-containing protein